MTALQDAEVDGSATAGVPTVHQFASEDKQNYAISMLVQYDPGRL